MSLLNELTDVLYTKEDGIARVTINRPPERLNALRLRTCDELAETLSDASSDRSVGVIVITGSGDKAFCAGGDQKEKMPPNFQPHVFRRIIRDAPQPVIAAVNGWAIGGGNVIAAICDLTIASSTARFGQNGPRIGSFDAANGAMYLSKIVGEKRAREMWFLCRHYTAQEAYEMGLVNRVVPPEKLQEEVNQWCQEVLALSPTALRVLKKAFNHSNDELIGTAQITAEVSYLYHLSDEAKEGHRAFLEKRKPDFKKFRK